ncbi:hypothetical protein CKO23_21075 [Thiocystis violacea]|nr:hypothetical protein [Thiocystis violacea]
MGRFETDPQIQTLRTPEGGIEVTWPVIRTIAPAIALRPIVAHKFTAYVYNKEALEYLTGANSESIMVLCVRDPLRALVSWWNMHRSIARSGNNPGHFAYKERDFYADCNIPDYYERFARRRLQYDRHFEAMLSIVPQQRLVVVSQERMAKDLGSVADYIKALARRERPSPLVTPDGGKTYKGYADRADTTLPGEIQAELKGVGERLEMAVRSSGVYTCLP